jgi:hypothetical protein
VVASKVPPYEREVFEAQAADECHRAAQGFLDACRDKRDWMTFGPYAGDADSNLAGLRDSRVVVQRVLADGRIEETVFGATVDAVFLTLSAVDKFVIPYYASVLGAQAALDIRNDFIADPTARGHDRKTRWLPPQRVRNIVVSADRGILVGT